MDHICHWHRLVELPWVQGSCASFLAEGHVQYARGGETEAGRAPKSESAEEPPSDHFWQRRLVHCLVSSKGQFYDTEARGLVMTCIHEKKNLDVIQYNSLCADQKKKSHRKRIKLAWILLYFPKERSMLTDYCFQATHTLQLVCLSPWASFLSSFSPAHEASPVASHGKAQSWLPSARWRKGHGKKLLRENHILARDPLAPKPQLHQNTVTSPPLQSHTRLEMKATQQCTPETQIS